MNIQQKFQDGVLGFISPIFVQVQDFASIFSGINIQDVVSWGVQGSVGSLCGVFVGYYARVLLIMIKRAKKK